MYWSRFAVLAAGMALTVPADGVGQPKFAPDTAHVVIHDRVEHEIDRRIFGHFLERPSWYYEIGPESAVDPETGAFDPRAKEILARMEIPVLRFPGGTDVDHMDWTDMIDNSPTRDDPARPVSTGHNGHFVTNRFGIDEALDLAEDLAGEMILVVNFGDCYYDRKPMREAVLHSVGVVAYANAEVGADLPEGMIDWPAVRAGNGRQPPWNIRYIQIANEPFVMDRALVRRGEIPDDKEAKYFGCLDATVDAILAVDPDVEIIIDGNSEDLIDDSKSILGDRVDYAAYHAYVPWGIQYAVVGEDTVQSPQLTTSTIWYAWVATPAFDETGLAAARDPSFAAAAASGYPVAVTEWNWNGWWQDAPEVLESKLAQGIGAAGFLHAFMRRGDVVKIGNQSMLIGRSWGITGVRIDSAGVVPPNLWPTGHVTAFYTWHSGDRMLATTFEQVPVYAQPYRMSGIRPQDRVAYLDVVATRTDSTIVIQTVNRHFDQDLPLRVDLSAFGQVGQTGLLHSLSGDAYNRPCERNDANDPTIGCELSRSLSIDGNTPTIWLPARSVSALVIPVSPDLCRDRPSRGP